MKNNKVLLDTQKRVFVTAVIDIETKNILSNIAKSKDRTVSYIIRDALEKYIVMEQDAKK